MTFLAASSTSTVSNVEPGLLGFLVVAGLFVALFVLLRSMNKQFHKIGPRPDDPEETEAEGASAPPSRPLRGLAAHRAAMAAEAKAAANADPAAAADPAGPDPADADTAADAKAVEAKPDAKPAENQP